MARQGLKRELAVALRKAMSQDDPVKYERLRVKTNGDVVLVDLTVERLAEPDVGKGTFLVVFDERKGEAAGAGVEAPAEAGEHEQRIADLERDLTTKEEYLRTAVEELETSNEELKSTNEELQSSNEELQSTNEELETSKEELQSVNEELVTVNAELQQKIEELSRANNDMNNLLAGTGIGTVYVDHQLRIQRFTPAATQIISLIQSDIGRPISDIVTRLDAASDLVAEIEAVLETLKTYEAEVRTRSGVPYLMRIQPYRTTDNVIEGAVLTFVDLSKRTQSRELTRPCRPDSLRRRRTRSCESAPRSSSSELLRASRRRRKTPRIWCTSCASTRSSWRCRTKSSGARRRRSRRRARRTSSSSIWRRSATLRWTKRAS